MFKKGKKKSKETVAKSLSLDSEQSAGGGCGVSSDNTARARKEQVDGFDENGFVDLKANHYPTLMGPKQPCQVKIL